MSTLQLKRRPLPSNLTASLSDFNLIFRKDTKSKRQKVDESFYSEAKDGNEEEKTKAKPKVEKKRNEPEEPARILSAEERRKIDFPLVDGVTMHLGVKMGDVANRVIFC